MVIIMSPSKTKDFSTIECGKIPRFIEKTNELKNMIDSYSDDELEKILKFKDVSSLDYEQNKTTKAILAYNGLVFKNLNIKNNYDKLYILSAYYGLLRPDDAISNYRLDMVNNIVKDRYKNMYNFWSDVYDYFENEDFVLNLASKEYSKMINPKNMITIEFYTKDANGYKVKSTPSKIMRGKLISHILNNDILDIEKIKKIELEGYKYNEALSDEKTLKFYN